MLIKALPTDDSADKTELLNNINKLVVAGKFSPFRTQEAEECLSTLVHAGRIMDSEGIIYRI